MLKEQAGKCLHCRSATRGSYQYCYKCRCVRDNICSLPAVVELGDDKYNALGMNVIVCYQTSLGVKRVVKPLLADFIRYIGEGGKMISSGHYFYNKVPETDHDILAVWVEKIITQ